MNSANPTPPHVIENHNEPTATTHANTDMMQVMTMSITDRRRVLRRSKVPVLRAGHAASLCQSVTVPAAQIAYYSGYV